jgi:hypothetical protein
VVSLVYVVLGLVFCFRWGSVVRHTPYLWISPGDLWTTYQASSEAAHGHFGGIYGSGFLAFPGILVVMAPLGALSNTLSTTGIQILSHGHPVAGLNTIYSAHTPYTILDVLQSGPNVYVLHRQAFIALAPFMLLVSCVALFALDALAERLDVDRRRRAVLCVAEAVLLWNVIVIWGHPEDALAVALAIYALIFALDGRMTGAGWLFGTALAVQPLVIVVFPLLLVLGGKNRALGLVIRSALPAVVVGVVPLVANFHATVHALVTQPTFPRAGGNHQTPWTFLAPHLSGHGVSDVVGGGPLRLVALVLAAGLGWWALRWRDRPEMIIWAAALALALRTYTESVSTPYYVWPTLAVGLVVAARATTVRFGLGVGAAIATTIVAQWHLGVYPWWLLQVVGVTGLLVAAAHPEPVAVAPEPAKVTRRPVNAGAKGKSSQKKKRAARR